jgi:hypothetical protein
MYVPFLSRAKSFPDEFGISPWCLSHPSVSALTLTLWSLRDCRAERCTGINFSPHHVRSSASHWCTLTHQPYVPPSIQSTH